MSDRPAYNTRGSEGQAAYLTPTMRRRKRLDARRQAIRLRFACLWGRTLYRPWQRLLHRFNLHHCSVSLPMGDPSEPPRRLHWCHWCGLRWSEPVQVRRVA